MVEVHTQSVGINTEPLLCRVRILSCAHKLIMSAGVILIRARVIYLLQELFTLCALVIYILQTRFEKKKKTPYFPRPCYFYFYKPDPTWSFKSKSRVTALILNRNTITFVIMFCTLFSVFFSLTEFHSWGNFSNI